MKAERQRQAVWQLPLNQHNPHATWLLTCIKEMHTHLTDRLLRCNSFHLNITLKHTLHTPNYYTMTHNRRV